MPRTARAAEAGMIYQFLINPITLTHRTSENRASSPE
jgi:hypothetical protein